MSPTDSGGSLRFHGISLAPHARSAIAPDEGQTLSVPGWRRLYGPHPLGVAIGATHEHCFELVRGPLPMNISFGGSTKRQSFRPSEVLEPKCKFRACLAFPWRTCGGLRGHYYEAKTTASSVPPNKVHETLPRGTLGSAELGIPIVTWGSYRLQGPYSASLRRFMVVFGRLGGEAC